MSPGKKATILATSSAATVFGLLGTAGCGSPSLSPPAMCVGQCAPPYQLMVDFKPHTSVETARSELGQCIDGDVNVIRVGRLQLGNQGLAVVIYTHRELTPSSDSLPRCLDAEPQVQFAGWPN